VSDTHAPSHLAGVEQAQHLLARAGLMLPPIPRGLARQFRSRGEWCFSSRAVRRWPYELAWYVENAEKPSTKDYVLLAHAGHGINSYAIHYYLVRGNLHLFLQVGWGGAYMDRNEATAEVNRCFTLAHHLVEALADAPKRRRVARRQRLKIVATDFYGGYWLVSGFGEQEKPPAREVGPESILAEALEWCRTGKVLDT
jgi:hypothetical protein